MAEFKIVISDPKTGKSAQKEVKDEQAKNLIGMRIGDKFKGEILDLTGYEFEITGGSDYCGFPMRKDVKGTMRKKILAIKGIGINNKKKYRSKKKKGLRTMDGMRQKKTVAGNTIKDETSQINVKILKHGKADLFTAKKEAPKEGEAKAEEKKAPEKKAEAPKEKPAEKPKEEKKKEAPKEEKKPAEKKE